MLILFKRLFPLFLIVITVLQFAAIERISEPFPALLLPPFQSNSPFDSIQVTKFEIQLISGDENIRDLSIQDIYPMAPKMTAFYMLINLAKGADLKDSRTRIEKFESKPEWKQLLLGPRENVLKNATNLYPEAIKEIERRVNMKTSGETDLLRIERKTFLVNWRSRQIDTLTSVMKTIPLHQSKPEKK